MAFQPEPIRMSGRLPHSSNLAWSSDKHGRLSFFGTLAMDNPAVAPLQMQLQRCISGVYSQINNQALPQTPSAASQMASNELASAALSQQQLNILNGTSNLGVYVVNTPMTLGNVCLIVHNTADQIINLNPALSKVPTIDVGTQVVFYGVPGHSPANALAAITTSVS